MYVIEMATQEIYHFSLIYVMVNNYRQQNMKSKLFNHIAMQCMLAACKFVATPY